MNYENLMINLSLICILLLIAFSQHCTTCVQLILNTPSIYLRVPEKRNKLYLFCRPNILNFSSMDKLVSRRKCKHKNKILHFYPNLFILLTYQLLVPLKSSKKRKEAQLPKNLNVSVQENLELMGYPTLVRKGSLRVRTKGKLNFKLINFQKSCNYYMRCR